MAASAIPLSFALEGLLVLASLCSPSSSSVIDMFLGQLSLHPEEAGGDLRQPPGKI